MELKNIWPIIEEVINTGGEFRIIPHGNSMLPLIRPGVDEVVLVAPNDLKKYDIVLYNRSDGKYVLHRLMYIKGEKCLMCGDNQRFYEYDVGKTHIIAKVKELYRGGTLVDFKSKEYIKYVNRLSRQVKFAEFKNKIARIFKKK